MKSWNPDEARSRFFLAALILRPACPAKSHSLDRNRPMIHKTNNRKEQRCCGGWEGKDHRNTADRGGKEALRFAARTGSSKPSSMMTRSQRVNTCEDTSLSECAS